MLCKFGLVLPFDLQHSYVNALRGGYAIPVAAYKTRPVRSVSVSQPGCSLLPLPDRHDKIDIKQRLPSKYTEPQSVASVRYFHSNKRPHAPIRS